MSLFEFVDYRQAFKAIIDERKKNDSTFSYVNFASAIGVQKTFISKVFKKDAHLSDDHLYLAFEYFQLSEREISYMELIYDYSRSGLSQRRATLSRRIAAAQEEHRQLRANTRAQMQGHEVTEELAEYYLEPYNIVIHIHLGIPLYQSHPDLLIAHLGITSAQLHSTLETLKRFGLISVSPKGKVTPIKEAIHLDIKSLFCKPHQILFRIKCQEQIVSAP